MDSENFKLVEKLFLSFVIVVFTLSEFILHFFLISNYSKIKEQKSGLKKSFLKEGLYFFLNKDASYRKEKYRTYKLKELFIILRYTSVFGVFYFSLLLIFSWIVGWIL